MLKENKSQRSFSNRYAEIMSENSEQKWRQRRLTDLAREKGGNASLGRLLGFNDGAYIGQMISGHRPITEKLIEKVHGLYGLSGWFDRDPAVTVLTAREPSPVYFLNTRERLDLLEDVLTRIEPATREEIGDLLSHFARGLRPATKEAIIAVIDGSGKSGQQKAA
jgi:hypothetical protein